MMNRAIRRALAYANRKQGQPQTPQAAAPVPVRPSQPPITRQKDLPPDPTRSKHTQERKRFQDGGGTVDGHNPMSKKNLDKALDVALSATHPKRLHHTLARTGYAEGGIPDIQGPAELAGETPYTHGKTLASQFDVAKVQPYKAAKIAPGPVDVKLPKKSMVRAPRADIGKMRMHKPKMKKFKGLQFAKGGAAIEDALNLASRTMADMAKGIGREDGLHGASMQQGATSTIVKEKLPGKKSEVVYEHHAKTPVEREEFKRGGVADNKDYLSGDVAIDDNAGSDMSKWDEARKQKAIENRYATTPKSKPSDVTPKISPEEYHRGNLGDGRFAFASGGASSTSNLTNSTNQQNINFIKTAYQELLGQVPAQSDITALAKQLNNGQITKDNLLNMLANSSYGEEHANEQTLNNVFTNSMGRLPKQEEQNYYLPQLAQNKITLDQLSQAVRNTPEAQSYSSSQLVKDYFKALTGQIPNPEVVQKYSDQMLTGQLNPDDLWPQIAATPESQNWVKNTAPGSLHDTIQKFANNADNLIGLGSRAAQKLTGLWDQITQLNPDLAASLTPLLGLESGRKGLTATAGNSSAAGIGQQTTAYITDSINQLFGTNYKSGNLPASIRKTLTGNDASSQAVALASFLQGTLNNLNTLSKNGVSPTPENLYLLHNLGGGDNGGGMTFLKALEKDPTGRMGDYAGKLGGTGAITGNSKLYPQGTRTTFQDAYNNLKTQLDPTKTPEHSQWGTNVINQLGGIADKAFGLPGTPPTPGGGATPPGGGGTSTPDIGNTLKPSSSLDQIYNQAYDKMYNQSYGRNASDAEKAYLNNAIATGNLTLDNLAAYLPTTAEAKQYANTSLDKIYNQSYGRNASDAEKAYLNKRIAEGSLTQEDLAAYLPTTQEAKDFAAKSAQTPKTIAGSAIPYMSYVNINGKPIKVIDDASYNNIAKQAGSVFAQDMSTLVPRSKIADYQFTQNDQGQYVPSSSAAPAQPKVDQATADYNAAMQNYQNAYNDWKSKTDLALLVNGGSLPWGWPSAPTAPNKASFQPTITQQTSPDLSQQLAGSGAGGNVGQGAAGTVGGGATSPTYTGSTPTYSGGSAPPGYTYTPVSAADLTSSGSTPVYQPPSNYSSGSSPVGSNPPAITPSYPVVMPGSNPIPSGGTMADVIPKQVLPVYTGPIYTPPPYTGGGGVATGYNTYSGNGGTGSTGASSYGTTTPSGSYSVSYMEGNRGGRMTGNEEALRIADHYANGGGAWTRKEGKNPKGGLNAKGRASLRAQGHDIRPPAPHPKTDKDAARRKSFCARMSGMPGPMKDDNGKPTRKALSLRAWNCRADGGMIDDALRLARSKVKE